MPRTGVIWDSSSTSCVDQNFVRSSTAFVKSLGSWNSGDEGSNGTRASYENDQNFVLFFNDVRKIAGVVELRGRREQGDESGDGLDGTGWT